jgi:hypothetical protein
MDIKKNGIAYIPGFRKGWIFLEIDQHPILRL